MEQWEYLNTILKWTEAACGLKPVIRAVYVGDDKWRLEEALPGYRAECTVSSATIKAAGFALPNVKIN